MRPIKVFDYFPELDAFYATKEYQDIAIELGLAEWTHVVWIGRLFTRDNDFGEHWFDNWDERKAISKKAAALGMEGEFLYVIVPSRFQDGQDGPCHSDVERKAFWTDVLQSLTLSLDTLGMIAVNHNPPVGDDDHVPNLKKKLRAIRERLEKEE